MILVKLQLIRDRKHVINEYAFNILDPFLKVDFTMLDGGLVIDESETAVRFLETIKIVPEIKTVPKQPTNNN